MHRKLIRAAIATIAVCGLMSVAQPPAGASGPGGSSDAIVASVVNNPNGENGPLAWFNMAVASGAHGEHPLGVFYITSLLDFPTGAQYAAVVTCIRVSGSDATVVGKIFWSYNSPRMVGTYTRVRLEDTGPGNSATDRIQFGPYTGDPTACPDPATPDRDPITAGFVAIHDAP